MWTRGPTEVGFARRNDVLAVIVAGRPGRPGRNLKGEPIAGRKPERIRVLTGDGAALRGSEVQGPLRRLLPPRRNWVDVIPYREAAVLVSASPDSGTCLLDFAPGRAPPAVDEVIARAQEAGLRRAS